MSLRHRLSMFSYIRHFQVNTMEGQALNAFNTAFHMAINRLISEVMQLPQLKGLRFQHSPEKVAKARKMILASDLAKLKIDMPKNILALPPLSLVKLCFHADGEYIHQYITAVMHVARLEYANSYRLASDAFASTEELSDFLNSHSSLQYGNPFRAITPCFFYTQLSSLYQQFGYLPHSLIYTDANPIELIGSTYIRNALLNTMDVKAQDPSHLPFDSEFVDDMLFFSAKNGCYRSAKTLTSRMIANIINSSTLLEVEQQYQSYYEDYFKAVFLPLYKTAGYLLLVSLQKSLFYVSKGKLVEHFTDKQKEYRKDELMVRMFHSLSMARRLEDRCKNIFRLAYLSEDCGEYLQGLFPINYIDNPTFFKNISESLDFLRTKYGHLSFRFDNLCLTEHENIKNHF